MNPCESMRRHIAPWRVSEKLDWVEAGRAGLCVYSGGIRVESFVRPIRPGFPKGYGRFKRGPPHVRGSIEVVPGDTGRAACVGMVSEAKKWSLTVCW
jgi:hypothetical protein